MGHQPVARPLRHDDRPAANDNAVSLIGLRQGNVHVVAENGEYADRVVRQAGDLADGNHHARRDRGILAGRGANVSLAAMPTVPAVLAERAAPESARRTDEARLVTRWGPELPAPAPHLDPAHVGHRPAIVVRQTVGD